MNKILLCIACLLLLSCNKNCDEEIIQLTEQYQNAIMASGTSQSALTKVTEDYNKRLAAINERCN